MSEIIAVFRYLSIFHGSCVHWMHGLVGIKELDGTLASVFDVMAQDKQSQADFAPLKNRMMAKFSEYKNGTADEITKLANDNFLLNLGRDSQGISSTKAKAMMRDYTV